MITRLACTALRAQLRLAELGEYEHCEDTTLRACRRACGQFVRRDYRLAARNRDEREEIRLDD